MKTRSHASWIGIAVLVLSSAFARPAEAALIKLDFTGTASLSGFGAVFGVTTASAPFSFSLTYDTSVAPAPTLFAAGSTVQGVLLMQDFYAYSADGITATNLTFGNQTWDASEIDPIEFFGLSAAFWVDANLDTGTPTAFIGAFTDATGELRLGGRGLSSGYQMVRTVTLQPVGVNAAASGQYGLSATEVASVPEPSMILLFATGALATAARRRRA